VRASTRLTEAAKALATRDYVRGISGPLALSNTFKGNFEAWRRAIVQKVKIYT
jgi:hypothetical protein